MKKEKLRKILAIRDYKLNKEDEFPKNPNNITKDELHDHFDLDDDGKVTLDEYAEHIEFHCDNPEVLEEELEEADFDKGFKYAKGGEILWKKNIGDDGWSPTMENESAYDNEGGYISESGNWKIYRDGRFYERWEDGHQNFKRDGDWIVKGMNEYGQVEDFKGTFDTLSEAKKYVERWIEINPEDYEKGGKTKKAKTWKEKYNKKYGNDLDASNSLSDIAEDTGVSKKGIQKIYNKGIGAYKTNPSSVRPNVKSKEQWAQARVYSAVMGGKAAKVDKKELTMEKGGIMDSRRDKDKEFDRAQAMEVQQGNYDRLNQNDKEKLKMIQQMMAKERQEQKEKENYTKGGKIKVGDYVSVDTGYGMMHTGKVNSKHHMHNDRVYVDGIGDALEIKRLTKVKPKTLDSYVAKENEIKIQLKSYKEDIIDGDDLANSISEILYGKISPPSMEKGGETDDVIMIEIGGDKKYPYYIKKIDTTHIAMANNKDGVDLVVPSHILQHKGESYYDDVRSWLRGGTSPNGKSYDSDYYARGGKVKRYIVHKGGDYDGEVLGSSDTFRGASMIEKRLEKKGAFDDVDTYGIKDTDDYFYRRKDNKYAKGGNINDGYSYDIEYEDEEGDEYSETFDKIQEAQEEIKRLENSDMHDYTIKRKYRYKDGEYLGSFDKGGKTDTTISNLVTIGAIEEPLRELEKIGKLKLEYLYNQLKISKNLLDNSIGKDDRIMNSVRYDSIQKLIDNILIN